MIESDVIDLTMEDTEDERPVSDMDMLVSPARSKSVMTCIDRRHPHPGSQKYAFQRPVH